MLMTLSMRHAVPDDACNLSDTTLLLFRQAQALFEFAEGYWRATGDCLAPLTKETSLRVDPVADSGMPVQVGAALAVHAAYCVKHCSTTVTSWAKISAADILHTVQKHASLLLQVASDHQVIV